MKKALALILSASLLAGAAGSAQADWGRHRGYYAPAPYHHHHHRDRSWVGPAAILAITGLALGAAAYNHSYVAPAPVVVAPPQPVYAAPVQESWYFCRSSGQYYPYTNTCPEGWVAVPAR